MGQNLTEFNDQGKHYISRRQAMKLGGIVAVGLIFSKPIIDTIRPMPLFAAYEPPNGGGGDGCTPGFWKNHAQSFWPIPTATELQDIFAFPFPAAPEESLVTNELAGITFLQALMFGGGDTLVEKTQIMLRAAVASYLNAAKFSGLFGIILVDVIAAVDGLLSRTATPIADEAQLKSDMVAQGMIFDGANNSGDCEFLLSGG